MAHPPSKKPILPRQDHLVRSVIVQRKDIEALLHAIKTRGLGVTIHAGGEKFRDLDKVARMHGAHLDDLALHGYDKKLGSVSVLLHNGNARIHAEGSFIAKELQHELSLFLHTRRNLKKRVFSWDGWRALSIAAFMAEFILLFIEPVRGKTPRLIHVYLWIAVFFWPVSCSIARLLHPVKIESSELLTAVHR